LTSHAANGRTRSSLEEKHDQPREHAASRKKRHTSKGTSATNEDHAQHAQKKPRLGGENSAHNGRNTPREGGCVQLKRKRPNFPRAKEEMPSFFSNLKMKSSPINLLGKHRALLQTQFLKMNSQ
jgi:hypothetical protein